VTRDGEPARVEDRDVRIEQMEKKKLMSEIVVNLCAVKCHQCCPFFVIKYARLFVRHLGNISAFLIKLSKSQLL
jgi:hypothetical protein